MTNPRNSKRRWRLLADSGLQTRMGLRLAFYWVACQVSLVLTIYAIAMLQGPLVPYAALHSLVIPALAISTLVLPLILWDALLFSNRFAGPLQQLRAKLTRWAREGEAEPVQFRPGDFYPDLQEAFNQLQAERMAERTACPPVPAETTS